jgi:hypothetical protein
MSSTPHVIFVVFGLCRTKLSVGISCTEKNLLCTVSFTTWCRAEEQIHIGKSEVTFAQRHCRMKRHKQREFKSNARVCTK